MEPLHVFIIVAVAAAVVLALVAWGKTRHKAEAATTEALLAVAQDAVAEAQKLADMRAHAIESDQAALAADLQRIATARARLAGNAPAAS